MEPVAATPTQKDELKATVSCVEKVGMAKDCWEKDENASKRPAGYKMVAQKNVETAAAAVNTNSNNGIEFMLCGADEKLKFPGDQ